MIEPKLRDTLEQQFFRLLNDGKRQGQEYARRQARLAVIVQEFYDLGCPFHGADKCVTQAQCLAEEITSRAIAWV